MPEKSLAHTKWDCTYHIVFIPKYRRKVLYGMNRQKVMRYNQKKVSTVGISEEMIRKYIKEQKKADQFCAAD